jgi:cysteine-rich repeat protein
LGGMARTDDRGGLKVCEDGAVVVLGGDGRWHRREECDDGNAADGDGCGDMERSRVRY